MPEPDIPFNRPFIAGPELDYIREAVEMGQLAGDGPFTRKCQTWLEEQLGCRKVLLTHSCTAALELAALLGDLGPGDEVIMPSYTFVSTANAFLLRGAKPVFVDIDPETLNMDPAAVASAIGPATRALAPVHYAGVACDMNALGKLARQHDLLLIEDAAQGLHARHQGQEIGTFGQLGCLSFHETKNIISGEGGALLINDEAFVERAEIIREKGTNRSQFFRGEVDKYTWVDIGSSYLPSELIAAFLFAQLESSESIIAKRRAIYQRYVEGLAVLEQRGHLRLPRCPANIEHNAHMFYVLAENEANRQRLIDHLRAKGIHAVWHYVPLHSSPMGQKLGYSGGDLPVTEELSERLLRLPCFYSLEEKQQQRVIAEIHRFFE